MDTAGQVREYDVLIMGAGPGGISAALALANTGLRVALIDKSEFPRDKVCGELMHRKAVETLNSILPGFEAEFKQFHKTLVMKHTQVHFKGRAVVFDWVNESYTCPRYDLDKFLLETVKSKTNTDIFTGYVPDQLTRSATGVHVTFKNHPDSFSGSVIVGADGANSTVARQFTEKVMDRKHYLGAVRAYCSGISDLRPDTSEVFFNTKFQFNYLWVFPVEGGLANVGFGMLSRDISDKKVNLKEAFYDYFKQSPELAARFTDAEQVGELEGFGVPLGSGVGTVCGERFLLVGDAASLSNPLSGTGIGNAVLSGKLAADQVKRCFEQNDFSEVAMQQYNSELKTAIIDGLMASYKAQRRISKMPFMLDVVFSLIRFNKVKKFLQASV